MTRSLRFSPGEPQSRVDRAHQGARHQGDEPAARKPIVAGEQQLQHICRDLAHIDRVTRVGEMAAGLAHELKQPLTAIGLYADGALESLDKLPAVPAEVRCAVSKIAALAQRGAVVVHHLGKFLRQETEPRSVIDARDVVRAALELAKCDPRLANRAPVAQLGDERLPILGVAVEIEQVLLNLIANALDAQAESQVHAALEVIACKLHHQRVELRVRDHGPGISKSTRARMFEAFFTTKKTGLGMGLRISQDIVRAHGGEIIFRNERRGGTTAVVSLPLAEEAP